MHNTLNTTVILLNEDNLLNQACIVSIELITFLYHVDLSSACSADKNQRHKGAGLWVIVEKEIKLNYTWCLSCTKMAISSHSVFIAWQACH